MTQTNGQLESNPRFDHWVKRYIEMRDKIAAFEKMADERLKPDKELKGRIELKLLAMLDKAGAEMVRTKSGTVSALVRDTASLADPDAFMEYVKNTNQFELMERRANVTACREHVVTNGTLPPGVKFNSIRHIGVRK